MSFCPDLKVTSAFGSNVDAQFVRATEKGVLVLMKFKSGVHEREVASGRVIGGRAKIKALVERSTQAVLSTAM